jgi:hypothetical protein
MKKKNSNVALFVLLVVISLTVYIIQLIQFHSPRDTAFYFLQDFAFLPLQVAIVTLILGKVLKNREQQARIKKINMVVSPFFNEIGTDLIILFLRHYQPPLDLQEALHIKGYWKNADFQKTQLLIKQYHFELDSRTIHLPELKTMLFQKRMFLLTVLENPNLLEHETFTDMLWAVFHLTDELQARESLDSLPDSDLNHLTIDIKRVFQALLLQWVLHLKHLQSEYPYLFSIEIRRNPFHNDGSVVIRE